MCYPQNQLELIVREAAVEATLLYKTSMIAHLEFLEEISENNLELLHNEKFRVARQTLTAITALKKKKHAATEAEKLFNSSTSTEFSDVARTETQKRQNFFVSHH